MKNLFLLLFVLIGGALHIDAQNGAVSDTFQLGTRQVKVPPPEGFIDTATKFDRVVQRLATTEDPRNETMASYVPASFAAELTENQNIRLPYYAKFSVARSVKAVDCSPQNFADLITGIKATFPQLLDSNSKFSKDLNTSMNKQLEELWGHNTNAQVSGQKNLGYFQENDTVFSYLVALNYNIDGKMSPILASGSVLRVNQRVIILYVFKRFSSTDEIDPMIEMTKKWTAAVLAANK